ncbi:MAG TPA: HAD-IA family hydrolase [Nocardioidaceae bacterium]|nr:HAD-IA family hydrolase [Nocardioidaceae bacterium]
MAVRAALWDADGVLQHLPDGWEASMRPVVDGHVDDLPAFLAEAFELERPALLGQVSWLDVLPGLLERWGVPHLYDDALRVWLTIVPQDDVRALVSAIRAEGVRCFLATNQTEHRGRYMAENLGYADLLDGAFWSYEMGLAKPDPAYFGAILERLSLEPHEVLFIDDSARNVEAARSVGLAAEHWHVDRGLPVLRELLRGHALPV